MPGSAVCVIASDGAGVSTAIVATDGAEVTEAVVPRGMAVAVAVFFTSPAAWFAAVTV